MMAERSRQNKNRRPKVPSTNFWKTNALRAGVQDRDGAAVLRPARDVVTYRDRAFLAVRDGPHPGGIDAARSEEGPNRLGTPGAKRNVVFAGTALVRVAFNGEGIAVVALQPE